MNEQKAPKALNIALWLAQATLAASMIWAAYMKILSPADKLAAMWPWTAQVPVALLKFTGIIDLLGGIGVILPTLLRVKPKLTSVAAILIIILMIVATIFHISRGESSVIGANVAFAAMAIFIAWGRNKYS